MPAKAGPPLNTAAAASSKRQGKSSKRDSASNRDTPSSQRSKRKGSAKPKQRTKQKNDLDTVSEDVEVETLQGSTEVQDDPPRTAALGPVFGTLAWAQGEARAPIHERETAVTSPATPAFGTLAWAESLQAGTNAKSSSPDLR